MTNQDNRPMDAADFRQKAEALARERTARTPEDSAALSPEEIRKTLHELRVHQIELEMQNEELRTAQAQIEAGKARYFDLYDMVPVGYCTLSEQGLILEANLTAATLLGTACGALVKQPVSRFILKEDQDIYYLNCKKLFETGEPQEYELRMVKPEGALIWAHLTVTVAQAEDSARVCRVVLSDITDRKRAEVLERLANKRLEALWNVTLLDAEDLQGVANQVLSSILELTDSPLAFFGNMNTDESVMSIHAWSGEAMEECATADKSEDFPIAEAGLWAEAIRNRAPLVVNDCTVPHPARKGLPEGHVALKNLMVVPLFFGGKITAVAAVANKTVDYDEQDISLVTSLLRSIESIFESKKAQEALRRSEDNFRRLLEDSPFGIRIVSETGETLFVNLAFLDMFEYDSISEWETSPSRRYTTRSRKEHQLRRENRRLDEAGLEEYEIEIVGEKGAIRYMQVWRRPVVWNGEKNYQVMYVDVTQRKLTEKALRESEKTLADIIEFLPDATLVIDKEGTVIAWNKAMENLTGVASGEMLGKGDYEYSIPLYNKRQPLLVDIALNPELEGRTGHTHIHRFGSVLYTEALASAIPPGNIYLTTMASVLRDADGSIIGAIGCLRNETERKNLEARLQQSEKMTTLSRISAGVAHEILNPVGIISLELQTLKKMEALPQEAREELDVCMDQIRRIVAIADNLKQFARATKDTMAPDNVNDVIARVVQMYASQMKIEGVVTDVRYDASIPPVVLDRGKIEQVLINLLSNAMAAMEGKDEKFLVIRSQRVDTNEGSHARIVVADRGTGIEKKELQRIFDPFYTTRDQGRGTGMGLSIAHGIISQHGGQIWAENNEWGGASFFIELPVQKEIQSQQEE